MMVNWSFNMFESKGQFVPLKDSKSNLRHTKSLMIRRSLLRWKNEIILLKDHAKPTFLGLYKFKERININA